MDKQLLFFTQRGGPLDEEIFMLTFAEFMHTTMASGLITVTNSTLFTLLIAALFVIPFYVCKMLHQRRWIVHVIAGSALAGALSLTVYSLPRNTKIFAINKNYYFISESLKYLFKNDEKIDLSDDMLIAIREYQQDRGGHFYSDSMPFYRELPTGNPLGEYFDSSSKRPNVVILILESFSSQVSGSNPTMGDFFTPFFDSLAGESLYWKNCMSSSLVSYEALPTLTGSLPFGKSGFNSIITYPNHLSLVSLLKNQGYNVSFITSSPMYYDNQGTYMKQQGTDYISYDFGEKYKHYEQKGEWNWGYPDEATFSLGLDRICRDTNPKLDVYVTISTHPPFSAQYIEPYTKEFLEILKQKNIPAKDKESLEKLSEQMGSFRYADDQLRKFFAEYRKKECFNNTIFIITGDHHGYFYTTNLLYQSRVPLLIYSPMLKAKKQFAPLVAHHDVVPSLCNLLKYTYHVPMPKYGHWLGQLLDTASTFRSAGNIPIADYGRSVCRYISGNLLIGPDGLMEIMNENLDLKPLQDTAIERSMLNKMNTFKKLDMFACYNNMLIPKDSVAFLNDFHIKTFESADIDEIEKNDEYLINKNFKIANIHRSIKVKIEFDAFIPINKDNLAPLLVYGVASTEQSKNFREEKQLCYMVEEGSIFGNWKTYKTEDVITSEMLTDMKDPIFNAYIYNCHKQMLKLRNFKISVYN